MPERMWHFKTIDPGTPERNPRETEFFRLTSPAEAVVREFIQNSLDAKAESNVLVRFYLGSAKQAMMREYLGDLMPHLQACGFPLPIPESESSISYLTVEDFETTGLDGPVEPDAGNGNFYNLWWREGISEKTGRTGGRWGLGKTTFHLTSKIRTFWGLTVRAGEGKELLMGKALLKTHKINNARYNYYGYFSDDHYDPIEDPSFVMRFKNIFSITRTIDSPGLSIVIPFPDDEISFDSILRGVIQHYFYPILDGTLRIQISDGKRNEEITGNNLIEKARSINWVQTEWADMNIIAIFEFIKNTINQPHTQIQIADIENPEVVPESFGDRLNTLQQSFRAGNPVKFRVPLRIRRNEGMGKDTFFTVFIKRFPELSRAFECYIRSGIRVTEIKSLGNRPVAALLIGEDEPLCEFLGDSETPAHTNWNERTEDFRRNYARNGARILRFIRKSLNQIVSILDEPPRERQVDFLKEIFSIRVTPEERKGKSEDEVAGPHPQPPSQEPLFNISQISGGFTTTLNSQRTGIQFPLRASLKIAYDTRRGNPFAQYEPFDFEVSKRPINIKTKGCKLLKAGRNELEIEVTGRNFRLKVGGFDRTRDLVVNITEA